MAARVLVKKVFRAFSPVLPAATTTKGNVSLQQRRTYGKQGYVYEDVSERLLQSHGDTDGNVDLGIFVKDLLETGLLPEDPRLAGTFEEFRNSGDKVVRRDDFVRAVGRSAAMIEKAMRGKLVVKDFGSFEDQIKEIYEECKTKEGGKNASYIPALANANPNHWGVSICTVSGQRCSFGDTHVPFTVQSGGKCFNYAIAQDEIGTDKIHEYIGMEPSGGHFNMMKLNHQGKPHNPMINSGALVLAAHIKPHLSLHERMDFMLSRYCEMAGVPNRTIKCDMVTCDSEMETAHKNLALINYIRSKNSFPPNTSLEDTLKLYIRLCSVEVDCYRGAVMAATLANGGICPITEKKVLELESVRHTLTLMHSCGMYDYSGEFAFNVGLPAKSGVSGLIMVVVPNVLGVCLFSPPINAHGNSVRGLHFCNRLVERFNFHMYDSLTVPSNKTDPRRYKGVHQELVTTSVMYAAHAGAVSSLQRYMLSGIDLSQRNYDGRTPLHVAASGGQLGVVKFLVERAAVELDVIDRWSKTPLDNALEFNNHEVADYLVSHGASQKDRN